MAQQQKSSSKQQSLNLNPHGLYAGFAVAAIALALLGAVSPPGVAALVLGPFGLFENLTVVLYVLALVLVLKILWQKNRSGVQGWSGNEKWLLLLVLAIILIGEEVQWLNPWIYKDTYQSWPFFSLSGLVNLSRSEIPEGTGLKLIAAIAGMRLAGVLAVIYAVMALVYYRGKLIHARAHLKNYTLRYVVLFGGLLLGAALMHFSIIPGARIFEDCFEMLAAGAFVAGVFRESTLQ